jgi:hypothetical protein
VTWPSALVVVAILGLIGALAWHGVLSGSDVQGIILTILGAGGATVGGHAIMRAHMQGREEGERGVRE